MQLNPYLFFQGNCAEAFKFYEACVDAKIVSVTTYEGTPGADAMPADRRKEVIHGRITIGGTTIMASDAPPGRYNAPQGFSVSLGVDTPAEAERIFAALSEKGTVRMPMEQTFFAHSFGMLVDRFGIPWMVVCEKKA